MRIRIVDIRSDDPRRTSEIPAGTVVEHAVGLEIGGIRREFKVFLTTKSIGDWDAALLTGDELLETLLRFDPVTLSLLYSAVGRFRRGCPETLPIELPDLDGMTVPHADDPLPSAASGK